MIKYIKKSFKKFKDDALSKMIYDFLKWILALLFGLIGTLITLHWLKIKTWFISKVEVQPYVLAISALMLVAVVIVIMYYMFKKKYSGIKADYYTDQLTGLKNYLSMNAFLPELLMELQKKLIKCSFVLIDIDNFKAINDEVGYNTADLLLAKVATVLANDRRITDQVFRYFQRGDEFLLILKETTLDGAMKAADRKRKLICNSTFELNNSFHKLTVSCGVTEYQNSDTVQILTDRLQKALKQAKSQKNKNSVQSII